MERNVESDLEKVMRIKNVRSLHELAWTACKEMGQHDPVMIRWVLRALETGSMPGIVRDWVQSVIGGG